MTSTASERNNELEVSTEVLLIGDQSRGGLRFLLGLKVFVNIVTVIDDPDLERARWTLGNIIALQNVFL